MEGPSSQAMPENRIITSGHERSILKSLNFAQLGTRKRILHLMLRRSKMRLNKMHYKYINESFEKRLTAARKFSVSKEFLKLSKFSHPPTWNFPQSQLRHQSVKVTARRFTLDEKVLVLALYKSSPKGYHLLSKIFALPSSITLLRLLKKLPFRPGINNHIFEQLKGTVGKMKKRHDRVCALIFDEISLATNVRYDKGRDMIIDWNDYDERRAIFADHANVFFLKGLYKKFKQPIAFTFSKGPVNSIKLKNSIKEIIEACQSIGLKVIVTICDQGTTNQAAIELLMQEKREECLRRNVIDDYFGFLIGEDEVVPLFDTPHLLKELRNDLLSKDAHFHLDGEEKIAKWSHIEQFYHLDMSKPNVRICPKLTDAHVIPSKVNKVKVKMCTQVLSYTVGALIKRIAKWKINHDLRLPLEATDTGDLILFLDKLFDSLNVTGKSKSTIKPLKRPVTEDSEHEIFWEHAISVLYSMKFYCPIVNRFTVAPSIENFIHNLKGFIYLREKLLDQMNLRYILTGAFNLGCLRNFFSYIRAQGGRNTKPNVKHFIMCFKIVIINNFMSVHSVRSNCRKDLTTGCLDNFRSFLTAKN